MARYIDAEKLREKINPWLDGCVLVMAVESLDEAPTADVVPKSEVEKLNNKLMIWKQDRFNLYQRLELYKMAREKVAREIFEEIEKYMDEDDGLSVYMTDSDFYELKKKYTEELK
jgi:hypothetical protein